MVLVKFVYQKTSLFEILTTFNCSRFIPNWISSCMSVVTFICYLTVNPTIIPTQENNLNTFLSKPKGNIIQRFPKQKQKMCWDC